MDAPQTLLLTGATGFVGQAIAPMLAAAGWTVVAGRRGQLPGAVAGCAAVVHLAGRAHVMREDAADPAALYRAGNTGLTLELARAAASAGVGRFVFISTAKVFGEGRDRPYTEADRAAPEDHYARSKLAAEDGLLALARENKMEVVILRPPLVYGPRVRANFLSLIKAVDRGVPLPLASLDNRRSLISVTNLGSAILAALSHPDAAGKTFAVSDGEDVSTPELIRRTGTALGRPARLIPVPVGLLIAGAKLVGRQGAIDRLAGSFTLDTSAIRTTLGWLPPQSLDEGLAETARWYREAT